MSRRKNEDSEIRKLSRIGDHSVGLTLPITIVRALKWRVKQKVNVRKVGKKIIIEDWK